MNFNKLTIHGPHARHEKLRVEREPGGGFVIALYVGTSAEMNCPISAADAKAIAGFLSGEPIWSTGPDPVAVSARGGKNELRRP